MRGRQPSGPEFVDKLNGSDKAKSRLKVVLETMTGTCRVQEACDKLAIKEARFDQIRIEGLQAALQALEDRPAGRPARTPSPAEEENQRLQEQVTQLKRELELAALRVELAVEKPKGATEPAKKNDSEFPSTGPSFPNEENVVNHLKNRIANESMPEGPPRRGFAGQRVEREQDQLVRRHIVEGGQRLVDQGWRWVNIAATLGMALRTLRDWRFDVKRDFLEARALGRPTLDASREERNQVIRHIDELGPSIGLPSLRLEFPSLARAELDDILARYRRVWQKLNRQPIHVLHWTRPGAVWAMDFHGPRSLIDDRYPYLFAVRDLSSGQQLLWQPVVDVTAATAERALEALFAEHGVPLVVKSDNGSAFIEDAVRKLSQNSGANILFSPPRTPSYNGSIEAGIGSLKSRTEQHAARHGHPGYWTWDDAEAARLEANATSRPQGPLGPSPDILWAGRQPITQQERTSFQIAVALQLTEIEATQEWDKQDPQKDSQRRAMDREAISRALVEHGYLFYSRRSIPLPITSKKAASIM